MGSDIDRGFISQVKGLDLLLHNEETLNGFDQVHYILRFARLVGYFGAASREGRGNF